MPPVSYIIIPVVFLLYVVRKVRERSWGYYVSSASLKGQIFLVTGANSGVGKETVQQLAERNATVIMACRDMKAAEKALGDIRKTTESGEILLHQLDLSSLSSVRSFAAEIIKKYSKIDVLVNNAGVAVPVEKNVRTKDGFEINFGVNHVGHFLLTNLLLPKLKESAPSRIVIVSSMLHEKGTIDLDDLDCDKIRSTVKKSRISPAYCNSKLANVYHARALAERLKDSEVDVRVMCPGFTYTGLMRNSDIKWWQVVPFLPVAFFFMRSAWQGSQTIVMCATEKNLPGKSGDFYRNCELYKSQMKFDQDLQEKLWQRSEELVKAQ